MNEELRKHIEEKVLERGTFQCMTDEEKHQLIGIITENFCSEPTSMNELREFAEALEGWIENVKKVRNDPTLKLKDIDI